LYYTASGIITPTGGRPVHRLREDWSTNSTDLELVYSPTAQGTQPTSTWG